MSFGGLTPWRRAARSRESDPLSLLRREMGELLDSLFGTAEESGRGGFRPAVDVTEADDAIRVTAEIPGVAEGDVAVELEGDVLTLRGEKRTEQEQRDEQGCCIERSFGRFHRAIRLPCPVDEGGVQATQRNGVLTIVLPKAEKRPRSRRIVVAGEEGPAAGATAGGTAGGVMDRRLPAVEDTSSTAGAGPQAAGIGLAAGAPRREVTGGQGGEPERRTTR